MKCAWCGTREVEFQLVIYHLRKEETNPIAATGKTPETQYLRDGLYLQVKLCEKCLPCTSTNDLMKYKLRGQEIKK